jgi:hypothetical protein
MPFKTPFKRQYSLRNQNRWLHWLALQNLFSERSHFQIHDIQPDRLSGRFQQLWYRLLVGAIAGVLLGGWFGLTYSTAILPFIPPHAYGPSITNGGDAVYRWSLIWNSSIIMQLPTIIRKSIISGICIGWLILGFYSVNGLFKETQWMQPLRLRLDGVGKSICISSLFALLLSLFLDGTVHLDITGFLIGFSSSLIFSIALTPKARQYNQNSQLDACPQTALANASLLLWLIVPSLFMMIVFVAINFDLLVLLHVFVENRRSQIPLKIYEVYPGIKFMGSLIRGFSYLLYALSWGFCSGLPGMTRSRPVLAAISLIKYGVMRFFIGFYGLGPFNYGAFLRSAIDQGILTHDIQGYQFVDPDDLEFYALMKFD